MHGQTDRQTHTQTSLLYIYIDICIYLLSAFPKEGHLSSAVLQLPGGGLHALTHLGNTRRMFTLLIEQQGLLKGRTRKLYA